MYAQPFSGYALNNDSIAYQKLLSQSKQMQQVSSARVTRGYFENVPWQQLGLQL